MEILLQELVAKLQVPGKTFRLIREDLPLEKGPATGVQAWVRCAECDPKVFCRGGRN